MRERERERETTWFLLPVSSYSLRILFTSQFKDSVYINERSKEREKKRKEKVTE